MKKLIGVLCILVLALCLTGTALAEDVGCDHPDARIEHDEVNCWDYCPDCNTQLWCYPHKSDCTTDIESRNQCDRCGTPVSDGIVLHDVEHDDTFRYEEYQDDEGNWYHLATCDACGLGADMDVHMVNKEYQRLLTWEQWEHNWTCTECGYGSSEGHWGVCGSDKMTCIYCGAENLQEIGAHINHPEDAETGVYIDVNTHHAYCRVCGDDWGEREHVLSCADYDVDNERGTCIICGSTVVYGRLEHNRHLIDFDTEYCSYTCGCGEIYDKLWHVVYCDSEDKNTCVACGKNVDADSIVISVTWHHDHIEHNEEECWNTCDNCGELYRGTHYFNCDDNERTNCASCGASADKVNINRINHTGLENNSWRDGDVEYHRPSCDKCGWQVEDHPARYRYAYASESDCAVTCDACGFYQYWGHVAQCSSDDSACLHCGAEGVIISSHEGHPDNLERYECEDEDSHRAYCIICGDDLGVRVHIKGCSGAEKCYYCGAEGVNCMYGDHFAEFDHFDKTRCYWKCACGEINYDVWHGIYCDSEDKNTCAECGNNVEKDGIVIDDIWHDTRPGHSDTHCWTKCKACGNFEYFAEHYTPCYDKESTHCDNCWQTEEDGIILTLKHTGLDHDVWEEDGIEWHRQVCWDCGYEGDAHAADVTYTAVDGDPNKHRGSCPDCKFDWTENHYAVCGEEKCVDCGAENVTFAYHIDHRDNSECYVYGDAVIHKKYCGICGDDWGWEEHVADCSDFDSDNMTGTCFYCGKENVNVIDVKHDTQYIKFDEEHCYYSCSCGEDAYNWQHVVYCDSDQSTCVGCGKRVETDGIVISIIWHRDHTEHDAGECWDICDNCGELYRGVHYFSCEDKEKMYCSHCDASREEVVIDIDNIRHADIDMNDSGDGWHDPWCLNCGEHLVGPHEYILFFEYGGYERCHVYCDICGYLTDWGHLGQCGDPDEYNTTCIRCSAEGVRVYGHGNHIGADEARCIDEDYHLFYCGVCRDEHYADEHKAPVGSDEAFGTCAVCGAKNVNLHGPVTEEEYIEDGIRVLITYHEDGSKHIDYSDAETGVYYGWENYENWQDEEPTEWEHYSSIWYETDDGNRTAIHRDFLTNEGDFGTMTFQITGEDWFFIYEDRYMGDGIGHMETNWNDSERCYHQTIRENDRMVYSCNKTVDWELINEANYEYFGSIGPVVTEREWRDDGTVHEYVYTNPNDRNVYEDRLYVDDTGYLQHSFHVHGSTVEFGQSVLYLPKGLSTIESEAFVGISARIVVLPENVTSIAGNAFSPDTVLLVPNERIALLAQQAGYAWFFF